MWILKRDGVEVTRGTDIECIRYIHTCHSYSLSHALRYEGYSMEESNAGS
jgi:hypothetical protein